MLQGAQIPLNSVQLGGFLVVFVIIITYITGILQKTLGILLADFLRPYIPWLDESGDEDPQSQDQTLDSGSESGSLSASTDQEQSGDSSRQSQNIDVTVESGGEVSADQSQRQGEQAVGSSEASESDDGDDIMTDGGQVVASHPDAYQVFGFWDRFTGNSPDAGETTSTSSSPAQEQSQTVEVVVNVEDLESGFSGEEGTHQLEFNYYPFSDRSELPVDEQAATSGEFPIRGVDGEAQISLNWPPEIPRHWIFVCTPDGFDVSLRDSIRAEIDEDSTPPRFRPEQQARSMSVAIVVSTDRPDVDHALNLQPADNAPCEPPSSGIYQTYRLVSR